MRSPQDAAVARPTTRRASSRRWRLAGVALVLAVVGAACGPRVASGPPACVGPAFPPDAITAGVLNATNNDRAANGLGPLQWNPQLWCLASEWSANLAGAGTLSHRDLNTVIRSSDYRGYRALGENLLRGPGSLTADAMESAWMNSPGHRANILGGQFTTAGVAYSTAADGQIFVTVNFGG